MKESTHLEQQRVVKHQLCDRWLMFFKEPNMLTLICIGLMLSEARQLDPGEAIETNPEQERPQQLEYG